MTVCQLSLKLGFGACKSFKLKNSIGQRDMHG